MITEINLIQLGFLLLISTLVIMLTNRLRIPYAVGLVIAGIALAFIPGIPKFSLSKELIYSLFLPPLIFEASFFIHWKNLNRDLPVIIILATIGVVVSAGITMLGMHYLAGWEWISAAIFGSLISATDPVTVIAALKESKIKGRLHLLLETESLFNDGTAAVLFSITILIATGTNVTFLGVSWEILKTVFGGVVCGALVAGVLLLLAGRSKNHLVELTLTTIAAYGSFLISENFGFSGILATLTAGIIVGNIGPLGSITVKGREAVESFWEYAAFVINSLVFLLIGMAESSLRFSGAIKSIIFAIVLVLLGRAIVVYTFGALFSHSKLKISKSFQHVLFWGGFRGALALALVLSLSTQIPHYEEIVTVTFVVVVVSILLQGLTLKPLLKRLGLIPNTEIRVLSEKAIEETKS